ARGRGPEAVAVVRFADEGGGALGVGVERDGLDRGCGPHNPVDLGVELADGVDQPHGGLSPVDDGDAAEHRVSLPNFVHTVGSTDNLRRYRPVWKSLDPPPGEGETCGHPPTRAAAAQRTLLFGNIAAW